MSSPQLSIKTALYAAGILIAGMFMGYKMSGNLYYNSAGAKSGGNAYISEIMSLVNNNYVDKVATDSITTQAIDNLLAQLDPHSVYIPPQDLKDVDDDMEGSFDGIGIEFFIQKDTLTVTSVIAGGPSEDAGILTGDKFISVDDSLLAGVKISNEKVIKMIRGRSGTKAKITLIRNGKLLKDVLIKRDKIPMYSVDASYMIQPTVGYIKINRFSATTYAEFMNKMKLLKKAGMQKLIVDLRDNPGGYLDAATSIADEFIAGKKKLVFTKGVNKNQETYYAENKGIFETGNLVLMIDEGSASASEILSGVVQDYDRGTIVGRRSFGKGLVQEQYPLSNGGALRLTIARYYIPSGRCIQKDYSHGVLDYRKDLSNRFEKGELVNADSTIVTDTVQYKTEKGRKVLGGGGITPDFFVPLDTNKYSKNISEVLASGLITEAINNYYVANLNTLKQIGNVQNFTSTFTQENILLDNLKQLCVRDSINTKSFVNSKDVNLLKIRSKAQLAKILYGNEAFYKIVNMQDAEILKALEAINK